MDPILGTVLKNEAVFSFQNLYQSTRLHGATLEIL